MNINFELYKVFYEVANAKSISKGAEKLMISQPAVSQSIQTLENELGGKLFVRTPKGVVLTNEGEILFDYIKEGMNYFINGTNKIKKGQMFTNDVEDKYIIISSDLAEENELEVGDYLVHEVYGIGIYKGIETMLNNNIHRDYINIDDLIKTNELFEILAKPSASFSIPMYKINFGL